MPTKNPRLNIVLEPPMYQAVCQLAHKDGVSLSLKARDLIHQALEYCENLHWAKMADSREKAFSKKKELSHKKVWA